MRKLAILLIAVMMTGCGSLDKRTFTGLKTEKADSRLGTVIYTFKNKVDEIDKEDKMLPGCPSTWGTRFSLTSWSSTSIQAKLDDEKKKGGEQAFLPAVVAAPLIAAGVSLAATYIVNSIDTAIDEYKKGLSGSFAAASVATAVPESMGCIVIVRGLMGEKEKNVTPEKDDFLVEFSTDALGFRDYPAFYLEIASTVQPKEGFPKTLELTPQHLSYAASAAKNWGWWSKTKHVGLALAFSDTAQKKPDEINEEKAFATFHYDLGRLKIGSRYGKELLKGTGASATLGKEDLQKSAFNITAVVSDSEDPGVIFQVLRTTFTSEKEGLQKALEEAITNAIKKTQPPSPK